MSSTPPLIGRDEAEEFKVHKCKSSRAKSRLRPGERVKVLRKGSPYEDPNKYLLESENGWLGWMTMGFDLELKAMPDKARNIR